MNYVLGFAFTEEGSVALIQKERPDWQKGFFNGVGGKIEDFDESPEAAMEREFREETGVVLQAGQWRKVGAITFSGGMVHVYTARSRLVNFVKNVTDEKVLLVSCRWCDQYPERLLPNVQTLLHACMIRENEDGHRPFVELRYP